jgi:hypothetical protein
MEAPTEQPSLLYELELSADVGVDTHEDQPLTVSAVFVRSANPQDAMAVRNSELGFRIGIQ